MSPLKNIIDCRKEKESNCTEIIQYWQYYHKKPKVKP